MLNFDDPIIDVFRDNVAAVTRTIPGLVLIDAANNWLKVMQCNNM